MTNCVLPLVVFTTSIITANSSPAETTLLLIDDRHVLYRSGTTRALHPLERHPANPLVKKGFPWEVAIAWSSIYRKPDSGIYQLWYQAFAGNNAHEATHRCVTCYAESKDGIHFTKPKLNLFPFNDIEKTNIVLIGNGGHSLRYGNSVIVDPSDPDPAKRYKMAYFDFGMDNGVEYPGLHVAFSPDGIHWSKPDIPMPLSRIAYGNYGAPVPVRGESGRKWSIPLSMSDAFDVFHDSKHDVFAIYGKMWIDAPDGGMFWKHGMGRIESKDFINWSKPELILAPDDHDPSHVEFHTSPVFLYADYYFSLIQILNRAVGGGVIDIELAISHDGIEWDRPFRDRPFLARNHGNQFDSGSIFTNSTPVILDDAIRFYYGAYSQGATGADDHTHISGVGLATLPRDRFASIRPVERSDQPTLRAPLHNVGQITLKPLELAKYTDITLNADASNGSIQVEVLDNHGYRIPGFTSNDATPVTGDSFNHNVQWKEHSLKDLEEEPCMLRIHLNNAELFAITITP